MGVISQICSLRLSHLFPRQPDGQSHTSGPTHRPPFMHVGSHTPAGRSEVGGQALHVCCSDFNCSSCNGLKGTDLSRIWSRRVRPSTSRRCSSCTRRRSHRAGCRPLQRDEAHDKRQRCAAPLRPVWFTVLTPGAVETARTLADAGTKTRAAVQTHGRAQRWRGRRALARRGGHRRRDTHTCAHPSHRSARSSPADTCTRLEKRTGLRCGSGDRKPLGSKPKLIRHQRTRQSRSSCRLKASHRSRIQVRQTRGDRSRSAVPRRCLRSDTATCTELQSLLSNTRSGTCTSPQGVSWKQLTACRQTGGYLAGSFPRGNLGHTDTHPGLRKRPRWCRPARRALKGTGGWNGMKTEKREGGEDTRGVSIRVPVRQSSPT